MNSEVKSKWVAALRSGKYTQTKGRLHRVVSAPGKGDSIVPAGHCCLGVLCELAIEDGAIISYSNNAWYPDNAVVDWAGLSSIDPQVEAAGRSQFLSALNDRGATFNEIADLIEEQL